MPLKWIGCLAALAASAGLAVAEGRGVGDADDAKPDAVKPHPVMLPPVPAEQAGTVVVLPPPPAAPRVEPVPCAAPAAAASCPCNSRLFEEGCGCEPDDRYRIRTNVDYLLWWFKQDHVPLLAGSLPPALAGTNPLPPGSIIPVFGGSHDALDYHGQSGVRIGAEGFFDPGEHVGLALDYFTLEHGVQHAGAQSGPNGLPIVGPTFLDTTTNRETLLLLAAPGVSSGAVSVSSETRFWGAEANFTTRVPAVFSDRTEFLVGFRTVQFDQNLDVAGQSANLPGVIATFPGNPNTQAYGYQDSFWVHDRFYGPQIGFDSESTYRRFFLNVKAEIAVGNMDETVHVAGVTNFQSPAVFSVPGGILAQRSNIGAYDRSICTFLPEITINGGVQVFDGVRAFVGYNLIYIDRLQRVGPTIDGVNVTQIPVLQAAPNVTATRPAFTFSDGRFWAQGLNAGLEFRY